MIQFLIRLPLARNTIFIHLSKLSITPWIVLFVFFALNSSPFERMM